MNIYHAVLEYLDIAINDVYEINTEEFGQHHALSCFWTDRIHLEDCLNNILELK